MAPKIVFLIRHCEKPIDSKEESLQNIPACLCSKLGYFHSYLFPYFIYRELGSDFNNKPTLIASAFAPENMNCDCEQREMLMLKPLSEAYGGIPIERPYCFYQVKETADYILSKSGTVIVSWEHNHINLLAQALGAQLVSPWPGDRFDLVFKLTYNDEGKNPSLEIYTQGDSIFVPKEYMYYYVKYLINRYIKYLLILLGVFIMLKYS